MTTPERLLPCPFCGSDDIVWNSDESGRHIYACGSCGCSGRPTRTNGEAKDSWNRRVLSASPAMKEDKAAVVVEPVAEHEDIEAVIACLGDDAAQIRQDSKNVGENFAAEEWADTMDDAARHLQTLLTANCAIAQILLDGDREKAKGWARGLHISMDHRGALTAYAVPAPVGVQAEPSDAQFIDMLAEHSWDLRCFDMPTGQGDADVGWQVVGHFMGEPKEREISIAYMDNPRVALKSAHTFYIGGGSLYGAPDARINREAPAPVPQVGTVQGVEPVFAEGKAWCEQQGHYAPGEGAEAFVEGHRRALAAPSIEGDAVPRGDVVVTKNEAGQILFVSRQDDEGRILSILSESSAQPPQGLLRMAVDALEDLCATSECVKRQADNSGKTHYTDWPSACADLERSRSKAEAAITALRSAINGAPGGEEAVRADAERYRWLRDTLHAAKAGGGVEVNDALQVYEKPEFGEAVRIYWYPDTPVGFCEVKADMLDVAIDAAMNQGERNGK